MSWDYKDAIQEKAEEIASEQFDCGFYDLPDAMQAKVYEQAMFGVSEALRDRADELRDREKYKGIK